MIGILEFEKEKCSVPGCNFLAWSWCLLCPGKMHCLKHCLCPENRYHKKAGLDFLRQGRLSFGDSQIKNKKKCQK